MSKNRLENLIDGVVAIIITIMVLDIKDPVANTFSSLEALIPLFLGYFLSFFYVAIFWLKHHHLYNKVKCINCTVLWTNLLWIFSLSIIPLATSWIADYPFSKDPIIFYASIMLITMILFYVLEGYILKTKQISRNTKLINKLVAILPMPMYLLAIIFANFNPIISLFIFPINLILLVIDIQLNYKF